MRLFVSHAHEQAAIADALTIALRQEHHTVFLDRDALKAGGNYHAAIRGEIERADVFVFLVSPESLEAGSYALTELEIARNHWLNPTDHVLPVAVRPTPFEAIPPYLKSVTVLQPKGDPVAETVARVAAMQAAVDAADKAAADSEMQVAAEREAHTATAALRRRRVLILGSAVAAFVLSVIWWQLGPKSPTPPCLLEVRVVEPPPDATQGRINTLEVGLPGAMKDFIVIGGQASIDVGPLTGPNAGWMIKTGMADGQKGLAFQMNGCPTAQLELRNDDAKVLLRVAPRR